MSRMYSELDIHAAKQEARAEQILRSARIMQGFKDKIAELEAEVEKLKHENRGLYLIIEANGETLHRQDEVVDQLKFELQSSQEAQRDEHEKNLLLETNIRELGSILPE